MSSLGLFVGYHRLITGDKNYQCRLDTDVGAHCNQKEGGVSVNFQSLGVCIGFDGDIEFPLATHYQMLQQQVWDWQDVYHIPNENIRFHRYYAYVEGKTCPGSLMTDQWLKYLLHRPLPIVVTPKQDLCTDPEVVKKAHWWDNLPDWLKG